MNSACPLNIIGSGSNSACLDSFCLLCVLKLYLVLSRWGRNSWLVARQASKGETDVSLGETAKSSRSALLREAAADKCGKKGLLGFLSLLQQGKFCWQRQLFLPQWCFAVVCSTGWCPPEVLVIKWALLWMALYKHKRLALLQRPCSVSVTRNQKTQWKCRSGSIAQRFSQHLTDSGKKNKPKQPQRMFEGRFWR